jgi:hypothetical protein
MNNAAMEVSSAMGYTKTLEYVNVVREIMDETPMSKSEYDAAIEECFRAGRDAVTSAHRNAATTMFWSGTSTP